jgi:2-keto-4-pentenoate hydratase
MDTPAIQQAAITLAARRLSGQPGPLLPAAHAPASLDDALAIQQAVTQLLGNSVGGWKCGMPSDERLVVAPIYASTISHGDRCHAWVRGEVVRTEPELAFVFAEGLPPRAQPYQRDEILAAVSSVHLALELIDSRFDAEPKPPFLQSLADGLVNQGLHLGPAVPLAAALAASTMPVRVQQGERDELLAGAHPAGEPLAPLLWLVGYLQQQGQGVLPGQVVITGSYAGVVSIAPGLPATLTFGELGTLTVQCQPR